MSDKKTLLARKITTADGVFVSVDDFRRALADENLILECAAMISVARSKKLSPVMGVRLCIANALNEVAGVNLPLQRQKAIRIVIENPGGNEADNGKLNQNTPDER